MKKTIVSLFAIAAITISAHAQTTENKSHSTNDSTHTQNRKHFKKQGAKITDALQLTAEQKVQVKAINQDFKSEMKDLKSSNFSTSEYNRKRADLLKERKEKIAALLTPEQKAKMDLVNKERPIKARMHARGKMENMKDKLALSNDQLAKIKAQREEFRTKFEAIKNNETLSADDKKSQMKNLREEQKNSFRNVLTPEQVKRMEEMRQKRS